MRKKVDLSVAIITKDEEARLAPCLDSISFADDIVVVDSGSTDRTVEIAREAGCRVFTEEWKGYGPQKNSAIEKCELDWVLLIDADERLAADSEGIISDAVKNRDVSAYTLKRKNYLHNRWLKHGDYWPDRQIRLVDRRKGTFRAVIHEKWETAGPVRDLDAHLDHYAFTDYSEMLKTLNDYSTIISREMYRSGKRANVLSPLYHGLGMFLKIYLLKRGFLDGMDGLVTALTKAGGSFFKYAKLLELQRMK